MEGPSIYLAVEQLRPFVGKCILSVEGNTKMGKERLNKQKILAIFGWGKHLVIRFKDFALRVHFMLFGSFEATVKGNKITGDYPTKNRAPRLALTFQNGDIILYSCLLKYIESARAVDDYDFSVDTISDEWDPKKALSCHISKEAAKVAVIIDEDFEDYEYAKPAQALLKAGHELVHIGLKVGKIVKGHILITAQVVKGRTLTGYKSIVQDIKNAGAKFVDKTVVIDDNLITSRNPDDLPAFCKASIAKLA